MVRKARQKRAETCGKAVLEQNLPSTPCIHVAQRGFWGGAVGEQEDKSARLVTGWPLANEGHFSSPRDLESKEIPDFSPKQKDASGRAAASSQLKA